MINERRVECAHARYEHLPRPSHGGPGERDQTPARCPRPFGAQMECEVVYREFASGEDDLNPLMDEALLAESDKKDDV